MFRHLVLRNWPLKLAAIFLSAILWVLVSAEETTSQLVGVQVRVELPPGLTLAKPAGDVRALATGPGRELFKLSATPPVLRVFVPSSAQPPRWRLDLVPGALELPQAVRATIQDVEPRVLELSLDRVVNRDLPVALRAVIEPESGFALTRSTISPPMVRVSGARALVTSLDSFPTELVEVRGVTGPFERAVPLDTAGRSLLSVTPREVTLSGSARRQPQ